MSETARSAGGNLPDFMALQLAFAAHVRDPAADDFPAGVPAERMQVYVDLVFRNLETLLGSAFPVAKAVMGDTRWAALVREFLKVHPSGTPWFPEVSQEFLEFVGHLPDGAVPGFLIELCHYEWVELGLDLADVVLPQDVDVDGDLRTAVVVRSPLAWALTYAYPVHRIGPGHEPQEPGAQPTHLVVHRGVEERVRFMEVNDLTQRLLLLLDGTVTGAEALERLAAEAPPALRDSLVTAGPEILERLRSAGILLGTRRPPEGSEAESE
jgi:hypothetical protein